MKRLQFAASLSSDLVAASCPVRRVAPIRRFEYWGGWVSSRAQPYCLGDKLIQQTNQTCVGNWDTDAQYLTGNGALTAYDSEMVCNPAVEVHPLAREYRPFNGFQLWKVNEITAKDQEAALRSISEVLAKDPKKTAEFWAGVTKQFPQLSIPFDGPTKKEWEEWLVGVVAVALDEKAVHALSKPFVLKMWEKKYISLPYYWRFTEVLIPLMDASAKYHTRSHHVTLERVLKIALNTYAEHAWVSDDGVNPYLTENASVRMWHESGAW